MRFNAHLKVELKAALPRKTDLYNLLTVLSRFNLSELCREAPFAIGVEGAR